MMRTRLLLSSIFLVAASNAGAFMVLVPLNDAPLRLSRVSRPVPCRDSVSRNLHIDDEHRQRHSRREFLTASGIVGTVALITSNYPLESAEAIGPIKIDLENPRYTAKPCPKVGQHQPVSLWYAVGGLSNRADLLTNSYYINTRINQFQAKRQWKECKGFVSL